MSAFAEFLLVAAAIYLWESTLWLPLRAVVLRRGFFGGKWRTSRPGQWMTTKDAGLVPMIPLIPDSGLVPCQEPPVIPDGEGRIFVEVPGSKPIASEISGWEDFSESFPRFTVAGLTTRISSPRALDLLRRARKRGDSPATAISKWWKFSLSTSRASREWRRWQRVSLPLEFLCQFLTAGFFIGLPLTFFYSGIAALLITALGLWLLMLVIAARLWWIGSKVYPSVKSQIRMDALLSALVPFHAMRALEITSVHAMAGTHPAAMLFAHDQYEDRWFSTYARQLLHPLPGSQTDETKIRFLRPLIERLLIRSGRSLLSYDTVPDHAEDPEAVSFCPRCHSLFGETISACPDCDGIPLRPFS